jgi:ABC-type Zn uptake system ZnuABC Zn-binding protein ZnuA
MTFSKMPALMRCLLALCLLLAIGGCGDARADRRPVLVATTTQVADIARHVAGPDVKVISILAPNSDPHEYELRPRDIAAVADADLVLRSGGDVDAWMDEAIDGSGTHARVIDLSARMPLSDDDPHWWQDPRNAIIATHEIAAALHRDPQDYLRTLRRLDRGVARCIDKIPPAQRKLVTTHDALGYYARRYGLEVIGTVIPSLSTVAQPSAADTEKLIATIRAAGVKAIFPESAVNPKVENAVAAETGARIGKPLWADSLGPPRSDGATYVGSIIANTQAIVSALTGGAETCAL